MIDLTGKVILVTGGSQGIGAATVKTLYQAGARVILHYGESRGKAEEIAQQLGRDACHLVQADLGQKQAAPELWRQAMQWQGKIDVVVNNAGMISATSIDDDFATWSQNWQQTLQVNLIAVADLCREAIHHFQQPNLQQKPQDPQQPSGIIINISSRAAFRGDQPNFMHYAASKGGVISLTRSIARGFAKDNILAYAIAPGFVQTERIAAMMQIEDAAQLTQDIPMGKMASPEDVAHVVAFLASGLSPHTTGTTIDINGASYVH
ncbi:MAG: SDR family oxidoreductase [Oscillatoriales cyanobacterium RM2_1_1]|nr:SDR family oxidoreductase [Oscillatoriales cyanobacterium SM2_3_0]NJO44504.1 SDR family oxidoreductase [Oscillatoriales cyanobacterium RM2_1_1]